MLPRFLSPIPRADSWGRLLKLKHLPRRARLTVELLEDRVVPSVSINIDASANVHAIDSNIYGTAFGTTAQLADLNVPLNRDGGNASDTYSFAQDATNHGSDWYFESIASGTGNGQGMDSFVSTSQAGGANPSITLNLFDWAAKLGSGRSNIGSFSVSKYGAQKAVDPFNSNWGNGVLTNGNNVTGNDPNDSYVANTPAIEQAWIQHLISTFGDSQHGGVQYYTLGNEPGIWYQTHRDIHPNGDTLPELLNRIESYASMVKSLDPNAKILGPEEWGWTNYFISGADSQAGNWGATYNGLNAEAWLLDQLRQNNQATGQRLLDYFTLHFYPQGGQFGNDVSTNMELLRNRSTRSLWDPNYVDESWIGNTGINGGKVNLINLMKNWVNTYYPGTKIGVTEYNWGAEGDMNGATTQADIWGIFGREGLDLADRWTTPATNSPTYLSMKMYRNYDGNKSAFGDTSVSATVPNPDQVNAFAAKRSSDGALTIMVVNKNLFDPNNPTGTTQVTLNISNFANSGVAQDWQLAAVNPTDQTNASITHLSDINFSNNSFTVNVPQESVEMFVLKPASQSAGALEFSTGNYSVNENAGTATITVTRTGGSSGSVSVSYATSDGTAKAGTDYTASSGTLTFNAGVTSQTFTVPITDRGDTSNTTKTVNLTLTSPTGGATLGTPASSVLTIKENDQAGALEFNMANYSVNENAGTAMITVTRTGGSVGAVTIHYATSDGTAKAGTDYQSSSGTLTFNAGVTSQTFTVSIIDRGDSSKTTKTIHMTLSNPTGNATLGSPASATLTIQENDLTHDERFVQGLYNDFLGRSGALAELDAWVALLPSMGRTAVANSITRSSEALKRDVNSLYTRLLNRSADAGGLTAWVTAMQNGMTEEQVANALLGSQEFANRANALIGGSNANANFVQALYTLLLGRTASTAELNAWLPAVASLGRQAAAGYFTSSAEFRGDAIRTFYGDPTLKPMPWEPFFINLLHRSQAPAAGEISGWVNSQVDFVSLEVTLAGSLEYYNLH